MLSTSSVLSSSLGFISPGGGGYSGQNRARPPNGRVHATTSTVLICTSLSWLLSLISFSVRSIPVFKGNSIQRSFPSLLTPFTSLISFSGPRRIRIPCHLCCSPGSCICHARLLFSQCSGLESIRRLDCIWRLQIRWVSLNPFFLALILKSFRSVIFTLITSFLPLPSILKTSIFFYAFLANAFFLVTPLLHPTLHLLK